MLWHNTYTYCWWATIYIYLYIPYIYRREIVQYNRFVHIFPDGESPKQAGGIKKKKRNEHANFTLENSMTEDLSK